MKVQKITPNTYHPEFKQKMIDAHTHVGSYTDGLFNTCDKFEARHFKYLLSQPINNGEDTIEKFIVSNLDCIDNGLPYLEAKAKQKGVPYRYLNELDGNREMLKIANEFSILKPLAVCQPNEMPNANNIRQLFREGTFYGLKFHPLHMKLESDSFRYDDYLKFAEEKNLPCLFHTDAAGCKFSSPEQVYELAKRHPKVPVILAHMGAGEQSHSRAIKVLLDSIEKGDAMIYADISWVDEGNPAKTVILETLEKLKTTSKGDMTSRLMFGTDAPIGKFGADELKEAGYYSKNIEHIKKAIKGKFKEADELINKLFYQNAQDLFFTKNWVKTSGFRSALKRFVTSKTGALVIGGTVAIGTGIATLGEKLKSRPQELVSPSLKIIA